MKAVVLVGGQGTRMRPLTDTVPKPLIPFMNRPFLHHVLDHLAAHGVGEAILSSPYLEEAFRDFLDARNAPPTITWITEDTPLGTSGAIAGAREHLDGTFLVLNGDVLTDLDLGSLVDAHREASAVATIATIEVEDARPYGLVDTDDAGRVLAFREKPTELVGGWVNAGTYVLEPEAIANVSPGVAVSIEKETFPHLIASGREVRAFRARGYWRDLGTPASYLDAHWDALKGAIGAGAPAPLVGPGASVDAGAVVTERNVLGPGAVVAAGATVDGTILHEGAWVGPGASVTGSILGPRSRVGAGASLTGCILGDGAEVAEGAVVEGERIQRA